MQSSQWKTGNMHSHTHKTHFNLCPSTSKNPPTVQGRLGMLRNVFPQLNSRQPPVASELPLVCWVSVEEVAVSAGSLTCVPTLRPKSVCDDVWMMRASHFLSSTGPCWHTSHFLSSTGPCWHTSIARCRFPPFLTAH